MKRGPYKNSFLWKLCDIEKDVVIDAIKNSTSIRHVCQKLNIEMHGSAYPAIKKWMEENKVETFHFKRTWNKGTKNQNLGIRTDPKKILTIKRKKQGTSGVRRALLKIGRPYVCEECGLSSEWNGKKLVLQVDHKSGDRLDDREENVRFLCPNCHSQTETFTSKNRKRKTPP